MKHLKLLSALAVAALLLGVVASCKPAPTPTPKPTAPTPTPVPPTPTSVPITKITVATDATWPPAEMIDEETKEIIGFDIDLVNAIGQEAGLEVEFKNVAWDGIFVGLEAGEYDAICSSVTILPEREEKYGFSEPYFNAGQLVVVRIETTDIKSHEDLSGKTAGAQIGTTGAFEVEKVEGATLKEYDTIDLAFMDLLEGRIDAAVADSPVSYGFVAKYPGKLKTVGEPFTDEWYGILVKKGNVELLDLINKGLA
ncbi:MAG: basic amino acid ABC transporter substrate-binding protein, partial [Chloroflexota bacterium]|nr:basic amino acid ABC transporter substrate-binding protein [Chloroflexota bacterium]